MIYIQIKPVAIQFFFKVGERGLVLFMIFP